MKDVDSFFSCSLMSNFNHLYMGTDSFIWQDVCNICALIFKSVGKLKFPKHSSLVIIDRPIAFVSAKKFFKDL